MRFFVIAAKKCLKCMKEARNISASRKIGKEFIVVKTAVIKFVLMRSKIFLDNQAAAFLQ